MRIVHISSDFPDDFNRYKTHAISNLIGLLPDSFEQFAYSINRTTPSPAQFLKLAFASNHPTTRSKLSNCVLSVLYDAPSKGLFLKTLLERLADWISGDIERRGLRPELIQGHKLSIEGIIAERVASRLGVPYALTIQGNTDQKIVTARPDLRRTYRKIYHNAAAVFPFSPWALESLDRLLGKRGELPGQITRILPCPTTADQIWEPRTVGPQLITAFNFDDCRNKNALAMIGAAAQLSDEIEGASLTIYGHGSSVAGARMTAATKGHSNVHLAGAISHEMMQSKMNDAGGFVLVSHRESFGMVFIEALLAGCPIVYPKDTAIDGYFDECPFAIPADPQDMHSIRNAMRILALDEFSLKRSLAIWQANGAARKFQRQHIGQTYEDALLKVQGQQV